MIKKLIEEKGVFAAIIECLDIPSSDIDTHESDVYLLHSSEREQWLKENYEFYSNCEFHLSNVEGNPWYGKRFINIPFANSKFWEGKR